MNREIQEREDAQLVIKAESTKKGTTRFVASTPALDSHNDEIKQEGWDFSRWDNNPVVLWAHDRWSPPIGKGIDYEVNASALIIEVEWAPTPFAQEIKTLYDQEFLRMVSVGFKPKKYSFKEDGGILWEEMYLLELSSVPIGSNPDAFALKSEVATPHVDAWAKKWLEARSEEGALLARLKSIEASVELIKAWTERLEKEAQDELLKQLPVAQRALIERLHKNYGVSLASLVKEAQSVTPHTETQAEDDSAVLFIVD